MKRIITFEAVRKPIYIAEITAKDADFKTAFDVVKAFKERNTEYTNCGYDSEYKQGVWIVRLYRECAIDFVPTR